MERLFYSRRDLVRMLHLRPRQLVRWEQRGLFPVKPRYEWQDLLRARALRQYDEANIRPGVVATSLQAASEREPGLGDGAAGGALNDARLGVFGGRVELRYGGVYMDALSGQLRLPFELGGGAPRPLQQKDAKQVRAERRRQEAEQWFAFGLSLEGDPELRGQAAAAYEHCLMLDRWFLSAYVNLGTLRYHQKNFVEAERCYRQALALDASYALGHFNLGNVLDETGRLADAIASYLTAVQLVPDYADAHYNLALAYQRLGQPRRAVPHWREYLGLDRASPFAEHARAQLKQALARDGLQLVAK